jgi:hypothetical protein
VFSDQSHDDVKAEFLKQFDSAERAWKPVLEEFKDRYDVYRASRAKRDHEREAERLYVDHVYQQIETIVPRMVTPDPRFVVDPREGQDALQARALQRKIDYDLEIDRFVEKQVPLAKTALICGVTVAKVGWVRTVEKRKVHNYDLSPLEIVAGANPTIEKDIVTRDGPTMIPVNLFDFFPDPGGSLIENMRFVFHRMWWTKEQLEARKGWMDHDKPVYQNLDEAIESGSSAGEGLNRLSNERSENARERRQNDRFEVIERWTPNGLTTIVNRSIVIRHCQNPYWHGKIPFVAASTQPDIDSFVGISEVEVIENIQRMIHKMENLRIDAAEFSVNPMLKVNRNMKGAKDITIEPGGMILLDRADFVDFWQPGFAGGPAWDEVQAYLGYMQQVSGVSPFIAGADPAASGVNQETATGASILQTEANKRLSLKLLQMQTMYSKVAKFFVQLNQQFMTREQLIRIVGSDGNEWVTIRPTDIAGEFDIRATNSSESLSKQAENQRLVEAIQTLMGLHGSMMGDGTMVDIKYPVSRLLENIGVDPDKCFVAAPQPQGVPGQPVPGQPMVSGQQFPALEAPQDVSVG